MKEYSVIVIDPPWYYPNKKVTLYKTGFGKKYTMKNIKKDPNYIPYNMMRDKEIMDFNLPCYISENAGIFLWSIQRKLEFSFNLLKRHNFKFKYLLTWNKLNGRRDNIPSTSMKLNGIEHNAEFILHGTRGKFQFTYNPCYMKSVFSFKKTKHSEKPAGFYQMLRNATPNQNRIDIFARRRHEGYDAFGDQIEPFTQTTIQSHF